LKDRAVSTTAGYKGKADFAMAHIKEGVSTGAQMGEYVRN
jgi:hypothetical protein